MKILVINPGSTSTKVALFESLQLLHEKKLNHSNQELGQFKLTREQLPLRVARVREFLQEIGLEPGELDVIVARGGLLPPVRHGAYTVNEAMVKFLLENPAEEHASNLGAPIALEIGGGLEIPALIYDSVSVDELLEVARLSGVKGYEKKSYGHILNMRAVARAIALEEGFDLEEVNLIVAHLGGGISLSLQARGLITDIVSADEGPYSTERSGGLPLFTVNRLARAEGIDALYQYATGRGGLLSYTGSNDAIAIEKAALEGDAYAHLLYEGIAYQLAKSIGALAAAASGQVRAIILTGGLARSKLITDQVTRQVAFIAPVHILPGELEMEALAGGAYRVMRGEEEAREFRLD